MRDMKSVYDHKAQATKAAHEAPKHLYRQFLSTLTLIERFLARWQREIDYWWRGDTNVYPFERIVSVIVPLVVGKTPTMLLIEAASRVPARALAVA